MTGGNQSKRPAVVTNLFSDNAINSLKETPAEFIVNLINKKILINDCTPDKPNFRVDKNTIYLNGDGAPSGFVLLHEGTHAGDVKNPYGTSVKYDISSDKTFRRILNKELEQARKTEPSLIFNRDMNYYFKFKDPNKGESEVLADAGALINTPSDIPATALRTFELMRNFPETIARCAQILSKINNQ